MDPLNSLKERLYRLEQTLQELGNRMDEDLAVARALQSVLIPNRTPDVPGVHSLARYISAQQISSESFDLIVTRDSKELWIVSSWTESFGLSSVLLQALVHLQSRALVESRPQMGLDEVWNDLSVSLSQAQKKGHYRLSLSRLNLSSLELQGVSTGMPPWLRRARGPGHYGPWQFAVEPNSDSGLWPLTPASSAAPVLAAQAHHFSLHAAPGTRLILLGCSWYSEAVSATEYLTPLHLEDCSTSSNLTEDMNHFLIQAQKHLKETAQSSDLTAILLEVDPRKLHIA